MSRKLRVSLCACHTGWGGSTSFKPGSSQAKQAMEIARIAKRESADLAVFPEMFSLAGVENPFECAEGLDGEVFGTVAECAKQLKMFIAVNHPTLIDGRRRNSTVLFDRTGELAIIYHKSYPTIGEIEQGCSPGDGAVVIDTEIGRLGFATCFDLNFSELRLAYGDLHPDAILFCSAFRGGLQTRWWAYETRAHIISAVLGPGSRIVNPVGRVLKQIDCINNLITHTLELDCAVLHYDHNWKLCERLRAKYSPMIDVDSTEAEGVFLLSATGDITVDEIIADIGLERVDEYFARARKRVGRTR